MDMRVNATLIRSERENRAWSQEHLAKIAGIGLRTVQRIEKTGAASYESASAIASVLDLPVSALRIDLANEPRRLTPTRWRRAASVGLGSVLCALSFAVLRPAIAEQIMLDVGVSLNSEQTRDSRLITRTGKDAEIIIDDKVSIVIVPTIRDDGTILLSTAVYELTNGVRQLLSEPRVATVDGKVAEIRLGSASGNDYQFLIKPSRE